MYDFNYFRPYQKVKGKTNWARLLSFVIIVAVLAFVGFDIFTMVMKQKNLQSEIAGLEIRLADPKLQEIADQVTAAEKKLTGLRSDSFTVVAMKSVVDYETVFTHDKLLSVITRLVDDAYLEAVSYTGRWLHLRGTVERNSLTNIAQLVYNLRAAEEFLDFNVNLISRPSEADEDVYNFEIEFIPAEYAAGSGR